MSVPITPRRMARHVAVEMASAARLPTREKSLNRNRVHFLFSHALAPKDVPKFERLVSELATTHRLLGHSDAVNAIRTGDITRPTISFSFDDGLQSNLLAAQILERHGTTGMFFVPTRFIGTQTVPEAREFFGHSTEIDEPAMTWHDLESLVARGHEIGNHTANHRTLSLVSRDEAISEIFEGAESIRKRLGECRHFAWPRGAFKFFPPDLRESVFQSGHQTVSSAVRGAHVEAMDDRRTLCVRRDLVATYWPVRHSLYFIANSARKATALDNQWPE